MYQIIYLDEKTFEHARISLISQRAT